MNSGRCRQKVRREMKETRDEAVWAVLHLDTYGFDFCLFLNMGHKSRNEGVMRDHHSHGWI